ncbi:hypothetical protein AMJ57_00045 [Parcubacteria bacterium SG8_24]|nr:MAG: hypothetical protein AMJ57_00045 [Parcubacteria bacterium SG8_24]
MRQKKPDLTFTILLGVLILLGLVVLTSASGPVAYQKFGDSYWYLKHQVLYGLLPGLVLFLLASRIDYRLWRRWSKVLFVIAVTALLLVFVPGLSAEWGTSKSWISLAGLSFQPAEMAKLSTVFFLATLFERQRDREGEVDGSLWPFLAVIGLLAALIMAQPDLGSLSVIIAASFLIYFLAGAPWRHVAGLVAGGLLSIGILVKTAPYRAARLTTFLHPELDPQGIGYHINQAFLAIGSGGLFGVGLGHSRQKYLYLPEVVGDSIFAVLAEELGFIFTLAAIMVIMAFVWRGLTIAKNAPDTFGRLVAVGIIGWVFFQTVFNIGSMVGILPVTGLPLPFVSYGGTALAVLLGAMGVVVNISRQSATRTVRRI